MGAPFFVRGSGPGARPDCMGLRNNPCPGFAAHAPRPRANAPGKPVRKAGLVAREVPLPQQKRPRRPAVFGAETGQTGTERHAISTIPAQRLHNRAR